MMEQIIDFFSIESLDLHNTPEQLSRQNRLSDISISRLDNNSQTCYAKGKSGESYFVTLAECSCSDFMRRHLPCKHMYKLATELEEKKYLYKHERSTELIADFSDGYAANWKFIVRPCNYASLDIAYTPRVTKTEDGKAKKATVLTQGAVYNFLPGAVFYDNNIAYTDVWERALGSLRYSLQINSSTPSTGASKVVVSDGILVNISTAIYGTVDFSVYRPNAGKTAEEKIGQYSCQQDEFLNLLKTGHFVDINGCHRSLIE